MEENNNKFDYTGVDTTSPVRFEGESFSEYKTRMKIVNYVMKQRLKGTLMHDSKKLGTYVKPNN